MQNEINTILEVRDVIAHHGRDLIIGIAVVVAGLIAIKWINKGLKKGLNRLPLSPDNANVVPKYPLRSNVRSGDDDNLCRGGYDC
jgi:hypothetical protein